MTIQLSKTFLCNIASTLRSCVRVGSQASSSSLVANGAPYVASPIPAEGSSGSFRNFVCELMSKFNPNDPWIILIKLTIKFTSWHTLQNASDQNDARQKNNCWTHFVKVDCSDLELAWKNYKDWFFRLVFFLF